MLVHADSAYAQGRPSAPARPLDPFTASVERRRAEQDLRALPQKLQERRERNLNDPEILEQMNEDFIEIQTIRAGMIKTFTSGAVVDPATLHKAAQEIRRRGARLRSMLALTEEINVRDLPSDPRPTLESVNDRAFKLCIEISRFTENPMFKKNSVITVKHAMEASSAIDVVIALAETIEKETRRLKSD